VSGIPQEDPLDYIGLDEVQEHGNPSKWTVRGAKPGSPVPATSRNAPAGTMKHYDSYENEFGEDIEVHYFRHSDGSVADVKIKVPT
jgi:hypothetical protein